MSAPSASGRPASLAGRIRLEWLALGLLTAAAAALILYMGRELTFFRDEWIFVIYRDGHDPTNFLSSHAGHLLLWPTAFFVSLFRLVGLDHYELYRLAALPWHLLCALLVFLLARRRLGDLVALAPAAVLLFLGSAWMDILWPFQIAFTGAIAFGLAAILVLDRDDLAGDAIACACLVVSLGWSGAALPFIAGVATGLLIRRRFWRRIWVVALPAVLYLLWLAKYGEEHIDLGSVLQHVPDYALHMVGAGIAGITGLPLGAGPSLALLLALVTGVRLWQLGRTSPLAWEALAMGLAFWGLTALARAQDNDPAAVRYVYESAVFLLLLGVGLAPAGAPRRSVAVAVLALAALTIPSNIEGLEEGRDALLFTSEITSAEIGAMELARGTVASDYSPELNDFPALPSAAFFAAIDRYGSSPGDSPAEIAASPEYARRRADGTSIAALGVRLRPRGELRADLPRACTVASAVGNVDEGVLPPRGVEIGNHADTFPLRVELRRFAHRFTHEVGVVAPGETVVLRVAKDRAPRKRWYFRLESAGWPHVCPEPVRAPAARSG